MYEYKGNLIRIVDADTFVVKIDLGFRIYHTLTVRMAKINAYELNAKDKETRTKAKAGKEYLIALIGTLPFLVLETLKPFAGDKYGRWVADIKLDDGQMVSDLMLESGLAVLYAKKD